jgi:hypothetical protein
LYGSEAAEYLQHILEPFSSEDQKKWIDRLLDRLPKLKLTDPILAKKDITGVVEVRLDTTFLLPDGQGSVLTPCNALFDP